MRSGAAYRLLDDPARRPFWLPLSPLTICGHRLIDLSGNIVAIYEIRNQDGNELIAAARER
jgi:hypothetical protein